MQTLFCPANGFSGRCWSSFPLIEIIFQVVPNHNHAPDPVDIDMRGHLNKLREKCRENPTAKASLIVAATVSRIDSQSVMGRMANTTLLRPQVNYQKTLAGPEMPTNPGRREDLQIPHSLKVRKVFSQNLYLATLFGYTPPHSIRSDIIPILVSGDRAQRTLPLFRFRC